MKNNKSTFMILVVEDEAMLRQSIREVLEFAGYIVETARDGNDGLRFLDEATTLPDLIISDVTMMGIDGSQLFIRVRDQNPSCVIPFIFLSSPEKLENVRQKLAGRDKVAYVNKPFHVPDLLAAVKRMLIQIAPC